MNHKNVIILSLFCLSLVLTARAQGVDPDIQQQFPMLQYPLGNTGRLGNISTRGLAGQDAEALVAGFVVSDQDRYVLIRAVGPTLSSFGLTSYLRRPKVALYDADGVLVASAESWTTSMSKVHRDGIALLARVVGAFPLLELSDDAVLHLKLAPGAYTAVVSSRDEQRGVAIVEVYPSPTYIVTGGAGG